MTTWTFEGVLLPHGDHGRVTLGDGPAESLPGRFALPGLVDAHCHLTVDADEAGPFLGDRSLGVRRMEELAAAGVTAVRDVGGRRELTLDFARDPRAGGPLVVAAGRFLSSPGRYYPRLYAPVDADELDLAIEAEVRDGATWVKLVADFPAVEDGRPRPGTAAPSYDLDVLARAVDTAHRAGARVAAHTTTGLAAALVAIGIDSVEHGVELDAETVDAMAARGTAWTPTLGAVLGQGPGADEAQYRETSERYAELLPRAVAAGIPVLTGSDVVGSVAGEVALLVRHGLTPEQALRAASTDAQAFLGVDATTDLVTWDDDPRDDPELLARPTAVVVRGRRVA